MELPFPEMRKVVGEAGLSHGHQATVHCPPCPDTFHQASGVSLLTGLPVA